GRRQLHERGRPDRPPGEVRRRAPGAKGSREPLRRGGRGGGADAGGPLRSGGGPQRAPDRAEDPPAGRGGVRPAVRSPVGTPPGWGDAGGSRREAIARSRQRRSPVRRVLVRAGGRNRTGEY